MAVYNKSGTICDGVYSYDGAVLSKAYAVDGSIVYQSHDYSNYSIYTLFSYPQTKLQGFAVYDGKIAQVREDYSLHIIDIATQTKIREVTMDMGHGNSCQFSDEFYAEGDEFPMFYIRNDGVWVYRIVGTSSTLIRKYSFSVDDIGTYVAGFGIDSVNRRFYTASYTTGDYETKTGQMRICVYDMDDVTDNGDGTYSMAILTHNDFTWFDRFDAVQGCCFYGRYFFISAGMSGNQYVVLVDPNTLEIAYTILIDTSGEIEGCAWVNNDYMVVGQRLNPYTYKKIVFGS